jgi:hypothetical protein
MSKRESESAMFPNSNFKQFCHKTQTETAGAPRADTRIRRIVVGAAAEIEDATGGGVQVRVRAVVAAPDVDQPQRSRHEGAGKAGANLQEQQ